MSKILILGAGAIGTAFSFPCSDKNHSVVIIGTHLENNFIDQINSKEKTHPVLQCVVPKNVRFLKVTFAPPTESAPGTVQRGIAHQ